MCWQLTRQLQFSEFLQKIFIMNFRNKSSNYNEYAENFFYRIFTTMSVFYIFFPVLHYKVWITLVFEQFFCFHIHMDLHILEVCEIWKMQNRRDVCLYVSLLACVHNNCLKNGVNKSDIVLKYQKRCWK